MAERYDVRWDAISACYRSAPESNPYRTVPGLGPGACAHRHRTTVAAAQCAVRRERREKRARSLK